MQKKRVGIIGFNYSLNVLLNSFKLSKNFNVIAICGKKKRKKKISKTLYYYNSWKKMITKVKPDIVAVAVPPKIQENILVYLLKNQINFICEKPISNSKLKISYFEKLSKFNKNINLIDLNFITIPAIKKFKSILDKITHKRKINIKIDWYFKPKSYNDKKNWKNKKSQTGGEINNFFFHLISVIDYFFEKNSLTLSYKKKNFYSFNLKSSNVFGKVNFSSRSDNQLFRIKVSDQQHDYVLLNTSKDYHNNFKIKQNNKIIYRYNYPKGKSRIITSSKIINLFFTKKKDIIKYVNFDKGLKIQKKIIDLKC